MVVARSLVVAMLATLAARAGAAEPVVIGGTVTAHGTRRPVAGARVEAPALDLAASTDAEGRYRLALPADQAGRSLTLRVQAHGFAPAARALALAGEVPRADFELQPGFTEERRVGSRAPGAEAERAEPVDVFTAEQIAATGLRETAQVLQVLAPSFNFPRPAITDGTDTVRPATLRGMGPDQVLVLVNGQRRHQGALVHVNGSIGRGSAGVDLNAIPIAAIERIEVLRDGAAAQYGSDAIAGVINVVLKSGVAPLQVAAQGGLQWGAFTGNACRSDGLACQAGGNEEFTDGELFDLSFSGGWPVRRGSLALAGEYRYHDRTNRASPDPRDQIQNGDAGRSPVFQPNHRWGDPDTRDLLFFGDLQLPLGATGRAGLYAFGGASRREANSAGYYRRAVDARNWPEIYPLGFLPELRPTVVDGSLVAGARGPLGGWDWDASFDYGHNRFDFEVGNSLNTSLGPRQPPNQTVFDAGQLTLDQMSVSLGLDRPLGPGRSAPAHLALGGELRLEHYVIHPGEAASWRDGGSPDRTGGRAAVGAQVFPGFRPQNAVNAWRHSLAAYADLEGDLGGRLRLGLAARFEDFSDFGSTLDGKASLRLAPVRQVVLRATASTGFRAPSLAQSWFSSTATNFLNVKPGGLQPFEALTLPASSPAAQVLGAPPLEPEESRQLSAGLALTPVTGLDLTADFYRIEVDDRVVLTGNLTGPKITELLQPFGANSARFFTNAIDTRTSGVDVTAAWRVPAGRLGRLGLRASYGHNRTSIVDERPTPPPLAGLEQVLFDRIERRRLECGQPRDGARASGEWRRAAWGLDLRLARYGSVCSFTASAADDQEYGARWLTDVELTYRLAGATLGLGVQNLTNALPDRNLTQNSYFGIQTYPGHSPFGMNGRFVYLKAAMTF